MSYRNTHRNAAILALSVLLLAPLNSQAAKKYYPPGFTPPPDSDVTPGGASNEPPSVIIQHVPGSKQVIIKTVPVSKTRTIVARPKPKDPLQVLMEQHRYYDALRMVDARLKKAPSNTSLQMTRGVILREEGSYEDAIAQFKAIHDKNRSKSVKAGALNGMGWTYLTQALSLKRSGESEAYTDTLNNAEKTFQQATRLSPAMAYAWAGLGKAALAENNLKQAEDYIKKAMQTGPENMEVQLARASLLLAQKKPAEALDLLYGIKKTTTQKPEVYLLLAKGSLDADKTDDAIINLKQLLELKPDHADALKLLSQSYERKMKMKDAEEVLEKAIALNPGDEASVNGLLKIYDQRNEQERAILLLKSVLQARQSQIAYAEALMDRLDRQGKWNESYQIGSAFLTPFLEKGQTPKPELRPLISLFAHTAHQQGKGLINRQSLSDEPSARKIKAYLLGQIQNNPSSSLQDRLDLLLIDPLTSFPALPANMEVSSEQKLSTVLQIAFLEGNQPLYSRLLTQAKTVDGRLKIARELYELGDDAGGLALVESLLAQSPQVAEAQVLKQEIAAKQNHIKERQASLAMLPRKISDSYWEKAASELLSLGNGDWKTHALIADVLEKRRQPAIALQHQKLAAQYAPSLKEKQRWLKKADKTARMLSRTR